MKVLSTIRKQLAEYAKHGFTVKEVHPNRGKGAHCCVLFEQFSDPQFLTPNLGDPRAIKNNIARFKRLSAQHKEKQ